MNRKLAIPVLLAACLGLSAQVAAVAQTKPAGDVVSSLTAHRIVRDGKGVETKVTAEAARPGDTIEYALTYTNGSEKPIRNLKATLPIPVRTEFLPNTAEPADILASVDGRTYAAPPLTRKVSLPGGKTRTENVPLDEYRYVRWTVADLGPAKSTTLHLRVRVLPGDRKGGAAKPSR
ncbi:MAG: hypothetical protein NT029_03165 [Armatimonadetes bacterium]|nr:hypothetical protein [Armatimonadota bacterium]